MSTTFIVQPSQEFGRASDVTTPFSRRVPAVTPSTQEHCRLWAVWCLKMFFWGLLLEGVLRKWVLPSLNQQLVFVRDPFLLVGLWYAWRGRLLKIDHPLKYNLVWLGVACLPLFVFKMHDTRELLLAVVSWRNHFYIPLVAFLMPAVLRYEETAWLIRQHLYWAVPITWLAVQQYGAGAGDVLNAGLGGNFMSFTYERGYLRPTGPFATVISQTFFIKTLWLIVVCAWASWRSSFVLNRFWLAIGTGAAGIALAVSGSRTAVVLVSVIMVVFLGWLAIRLIKDPVRHLGKATMVGLVLTVVAFVSFSYFYDPIDALRERFINAGDTQRLDLGLSDRIAQSMFGFLYFTSLNTPVLGFGLGEALNASVLLNDKPFVVENDLDRHVYEMGPFLGIAYCLWRWRFYFWVLASGWARHKLCSSAYPLVFGIGGASQLLFELITGNTPVNSYAWFLVGMSLAIINTEKTREELKQIASTKTS